MVNMDKSTGMSKSESPKLARALYTNTPEAKNELFFRKGDILQVLEFDHEGQSGWWLCTLLGQRGVCPGNYLEVLEHDYQNHGEDAIPSYDVPKSYNPPVELNPLDLYDVPKNPLPIYTSASLVRSRKHGSNALTLGSAGSSNRASSASSASCSSQSTSSGSERSFPVKSAQSSVVPQKETDVSIYSNDEALRELEKLIQATTYKSALPKQTSVNSELDYDVPRPSAVTSRPPSSLNLTSSSSMSGSRSCVTLPDSDSKESLDLYDVPRSDVKNCVSLFENKYDHVHYRPPPCASYISQRRDASKRSSISSTASSSSSSNPQASIEAHFGVILRNAGTLKNAGSIGSVNSKNDSICEAYDVPPSIPGNGSLRSSSLSTSSLDASCYDMPKAESMCDSTETLSCHGGHDNVTGRRKPLTHDTSRISLATSIHFGNNHQSSSLPLEVKILPLCPKAAVAICEKLKQEVVTSITAILNFVKPKWRLKENLNEIMPDLRFGCVRLNLGVKDFAEFCYRAVSNARKFKLDPLVIRLQKLLAPVSNASQIIQKDVDELEAYLWSVDRLSVTADEKDPGDALDQLVLCARSLQYDATEISNFIALNSTTLFQEVEESTTNKANSVLSVTSNSTPIVDEGQEDYDYVTLSSAPAVVDEEQKVTDAISLLNSKDQQILEFYSAQIGSITPLLSQSISTFISSVHQNDPPRIFNGHLKYVILLAYKMLFAGDTIHRNFGNEEVKAEVEAKSDELHKAVVALHEASKTATRDFPKILPMQKIIDHIWETTSAAAQLKKVIFNAAI